MLMTALPAPLPGPEDEAAPAPSPPLARFSASPPAHLKAGVLRRLGDEVTTAPTPVHSPSTRFPRARGALAHQQPLYALDRYPESSDTDGEADSVLHPRQLNISPAVQATVPDMPRKPMEAAVRKSPPAGDVVERAAEAAGLRTTPSPPPPPSRQIPSVLTVPAVGDALVIGLMYRPLPLALMAAVFVARSAPAEVQGGTRIPAWAGVLGALALVWAAWAAAGMDWELVMPSLVYLLCAEGYHMEIDWSPKYRRLLLNAATVSPRQAIIKSLSAAASTAQTPLPSSAPLAESTAESSGAT